MSKWSPLIVGRYTIFDRIASGGMASVHYGRQTGELGFARTVAVKRLHPHLAENPDFLSVLVDEARLAARIHHPNVATTLDVVTMEGEVLLVLEYVRGESLSRLLRALSARRETTPLAMASAIGVGALSGLHAAHEATGEGGEPLGIVHRDVSPQNILVGVDGAPRVIDFGIAKAADRSQTTRDGVVKGKTSYMAPEQLQGGAVTRRSDVFSMAVVLWETLTGRGLFEAESDEERALRVREGAKAPPSAFSSLVPPEVDAVVMRGLSQDPKERFATARDMAEALASAARPALPAEVGAWVSEIAAKSLKERAEIVAEIEAHKPRASVEGERRDRRPSDRDEVPTIASRAVSVVVNATERSPRGLPVGRAAIVLAAGVSVVIGLIATQRVSSPPPEEPRAVAGSGPALVPPPPVVALPLPTPPEAPSASPSSSVPPAPSAMVKRAPPSRAQLPKPRPSVDPLAP